MHGGVGDSDHGDGDAGCHEEQWNAGDGNCYPDLQVNLEVNLAVRRCTSFCAAVRLRAQFVYSVRLAPI